MENLLFANQVCKHVKSNAIVVTKANKTLGIGAGQTSRVGSSEIACEHANKFFSGKLENCGAASDAFFPFADGLGKSRRTRSKVNYPTRRVNS